MRAWLLGWATIALAVAAGIVGYVVFSGARFCIDPPGFFYGTRFDCRNVESLHGP